MPCPIPALIRRARGSDLAAIAGLRVAFERITRDSGSMDEDDRRKEIEGLLGRDFRRGRLLCWVAEEGGRVVAQAAVRLRGGRARTAAGAGTAAGASLYGELINVYTEPAHRGRGIGSALVGAAISEARVLGLARLVLQATDDSRRIYERAGFSSGGRGMSLEMY